MALLNRRLKDKDPELLPFIDEENNESYEEEVFQHHGITLWISDSLLMLIEHIQLYAVFVVLSERWSWPLDWMKETSFTLLFNLDIWEFYKINYGGYDGASNVFVPSDMMFSYKKYLISWTIIISFLLLTYVAVYQRLLHKRPLYLLLYLSRMKRIFAIGVQFLSIPLGLTVARLFHCRPGEANTNTVLNVANDVTCWSKEHGIYGIQSLGWLLVIITIIIIIIYPSYLWYTIKKEVFTHSNKQHEGYLQLKEAEYLKGLDIVWAVEQFFHFSSYRRPWVYYRPIICYLRFLFVFVYVISLKYQVYPIGIIAATLFLMALVMIPMKPFRIHVFNVMKIISLLCNSLNALFGFLLELKVESAVLIYPYLKYALIGINMIALCSFALFFIYLILHHYNFLGVQPLWPALSKDINSHDLDHATKLYLRAVFRGRQVLERALSTPPIFVHVHELERQIQIINAYCREAEVINNPAFDSLWDLLDELIEAHTVFNKKSLFSESDKSSVHETANELMKIMPAFRRRLDKREYDFILMNPTKKRILLKMYALGLFLNGRSTRVQESVQKKLRFDQLKQPQRKEYTHSPAGSSSSDSISLPNTAGTSLERVTLRDSIADLLEHADNVTNKINDPVKKTNDTNILTIDEEQHSNLRINTSQNSEIASDSFMSLPGTVTYDPQIV